MSAKLYAIYPVRYDMPVQRLFPESHGRKANVVEIPFQDCAILPQTVSPTFKAEAKVVRNDLLFPERQAIKCLIELLLLLRTGTI